MGNDEKSIFTDCQLRNAANGVIGASVASGGISDFTRDSHEITVTGGIVVDPGTIGKAILYCREAFGPVRVEGAQMVVLQIGGFF